METCGFEIDTANVFTAGTGIRLGTGHKVQAHKNTILLQDEEKGKTGIRLSGTTDAWLRCNTVMGPAMAPYSVDSYGFDAVGASGKLITHTAGHFLDTEYADLPAARRGLAGREDTEPHRGLIINGKLCVSLCWTLCALCPKPFCPVVC